MKYIIESSPKKGERILYYCGTDFHPNVNLLKMAIIRAIKEL